LAERSDINTLFARVDNHIINVLAGYWRRGGTIQWFAQVSPEPGKLSAEPIDWRALMRLATNEGAVGMYIHGGIADYWYANHQLENFYSANEYMRGLVGASGFAAHQPVVHTWIRDHLGVDFQMCSHYNPTDRSRTAGHSSLNERWKLTDRTAMLAVVATLDCPVVHYKIIAGGNMPVEEAFVNLGIASKTNHVACVGVFPPDDPDMITKNIQLWEQHVERIMEVNKSG
jgi:hypothetical protein